MTDNYVKITVYRMNRNNNNITSASVINNKNSNNKYKRILHSHRRPQQHITASMAGHILCYFVMVICITRQILSVNSVRCHQCNSHTDDNCISLHSNSQLIDDTYLKECVDEGNNKRAFCRKTVLKIEVNGEQRVIRSCGWMYDRSYMAKNSCFSADNEGYTQIICACHEDGCNGGNTLINSLALKWITFSSVLVSLYCSITF